MAKFKLNQNALLAGGIAGAGEGYGAQFLGPNLGPAVVDGAVGAYFNNETLQTMAGMRAGRLATGILPAGTGGATPGVL